MYGCLDVWMDLLADTERVQRKVATESSVSAICDGSFFLSIFCCGVRDTVYVRFCHFRPFDPSSQSSRSKKIKKSSDRFSTIGCVAPKIGRGAASRQPANQIYLFGTSIFVTGDNRGPPNLLKSI